MAKMKYIIIIGCGKLGSELAIRLSQNHSVIVVDKDPEALSDLKSKNFTGFVMVLDSSDIEVFRDLKADQADIIYIVTRDDNLNFMLALAADMFVNKDEKKVKIIARVNDPAKKILFKEGNVEVFCPIEQAVDYLLSGFEGDENK